jgi:hypothetical protein
MSELDKNNEIAKIIGKTIKHYAIYGDQVDLTFTDNTKLLVGLNDNKNIIHFYKNGFLLLLDQTNHQATYIHHNACPLPHYREPTEVEKHLYEVIINNLILELKGLI